MPTATNILLEMKKKRQTSITYACIQTHATYTKPMPKTMEILPNTVTFVPTTVETIPLIRQNNKDVFIMIKFGSVRNCNNFIAKVVGMTKSYYISAATTFAIKNRNCNKNLLK